MKEKNSLLLTLLSQVCHHSDRANMEPMEPFVPVAVIPFEVTGVGFLKKLCLQHWLVWESYLWYGWEQLV